MLINNCKDKEYTYVHYTLYSIHTTLHYITLHYTTLHYTTPHTHTHSASSVIQISVIRHLNYLKSSDNCSIRVFRKEMYVLLEHFVIGVCSIRVFQQISVYNKSMGFIYLNKFTYLNTFLRSLVQRCSDNQGCTVLQTSHSYIQYHSHIRDFH